MTERALSLLDPDARLVIGHRGASAEAPENTLAAFRRAAELGVDGFEFDVRVPARRRDIACAGPLHTIVPRGLARAWRAATVAIK